jgi:hypothetical protein
MHMVSAIKFHIPNPNGLLVIVKKQKSKHNLHTAAMLCYITKKNSTQVTPESVHLFYDAVSS